MPLSHLLFSLPVNVYYCISSMLMKTLLLTLLFAGIANFCDAQTYISFVPSITNTAGTIAEKSNFSFEVGRQWDVFSMGIDIGKTSLGKVVGRDTTTYLELRPNLNIFQQGKFTNTLTPGIGCIFNAKETLMTELTSGIEYSYNDLIHLNIYFGQYYYSGKISSSTATFFGLSIMKYFAPAHPKSLITNGHT
ncbi:MAG: hypothetical protein JWQ38_3721 [Flavipsychrobacter sp.]|nr:hypothetical protein [Flavipsychrobacter sp.]